MKIAIATSNMDLVRAIKASSRYEILSSFSERDEMFSKLRALSEDPEVLLFVEPFDCQGSSFVDVFSKVRKEHPALRIVCLFGEENTTGRMRILKKLVENLEIYDIAIAGEEGVGLDDIFELIDNPKDLTYASRILDYNETDTYKNVFAISSIKPGTGKTFLATNLAVAIAKYGQKRRMQNGKMVDPKVLLVDADLLNLGVSSILRTDNYDRNMLTALQRIEKEIDDDVNYPSSAEVEQIKTFVRGCLSMYSRCNNLYVMAASAIPLEELSKIAPTHFYFMMQMLVRAFDVIIVDTNSAFDHQTTPVMYEIAGTIFLMIDNDYNNIQNNLRYIESLRERGYDDKVKFIVNKDLTKEAELSCLEDLEYNTNSIGDLVIDFRVPNIDAGIIKSLDYGENLVITSDKAKDAKNKILEIADSIWKIDQSRIIEVEETEQQPKKTNKLINLLNK